MFALAALLTLASSPVEISPGIQLTYHGSFAAEKGDLASSEKQFDVTYVVGPTQGGERPLYWTTVERGHGGWAWPDRLGSWQLNERLRPAGGTNPTLLYQRESGVHVVGLQTPFVTYTEPFALGVTWVEGNLESKVAGEEMVGDVPCWRIEVRSPIGRKRMTWVEKSSPIVRAMVETVFIGQGEQHELKWELKSQSTLASESLAAQETAFAEFLRLRTRLGVEPQTRDLQWNSEQLALIRADLPTLVAKSGNTLLSSLAQAVEQDTKNQKERAGALGALQSRLVGQVAPQPPIETISGEKLAWKDLQGKVTVLHFWDYRDAPLEEPYGQVAYVDFLARKNTLADVKIYGVIADERVAQPDTKRAGIQSAKRLQAFMNLSYPLLVDAQNAIREFGDPRKTGAKLPLVIVIDRQGKVAHYHVGHYEVDRDRGLEQLQQVIQAAVDKRG